MALVDVLASECVSAFDQDAHEEGEDEGEVIDAGGPEDSTSISLDVDISSGLVYALPPDSEEARKEQRSSKATRQRTARFADEDNSPTKLEGNASRLPLPAKTLRNGTRRTLAPVTPRNNMPIFNFNKIVDGVLPRQGRSLRPLKEKMVGRLDCEWLRAAELSVPMEVNRKSNSISAIPIPSIVRRMPVLGNIPDEITPEGYFRIFTEMKTVETVDVKKDGHHLARLLPHRYTKKMPFYGSSPRLLMMAKQQTPFKTPAPVERSPPSMFTPARPDAIQANKQIVGKPRRLLPPLRKERPRPKPLAKSIPHTPVPPPATSVEIPPTPPLEAAVEAAVEDPPPPPVVRRRSSIKPKRKRKESKAVIVLHANPEVAEELATTPPPEPAEQLISAAPLEMDPQGATAALAESDIAAWATEPAPQPTTTDTSLPTSDPTTKDKVAPYKPRRPTPPRHVSTNLPSLDKGEASPPEDPTKEETDVMPAEAGRSVDPAADLAAKKARMAQFAGRNHKPGGEGGAESRRQSVAAGMPGARRMSVMKPAIDMETMRRRRLNKDAPHRQGLEKEKDDFLTSLLNDMNVLDDEAKKRYIRLTDPFFKGADRELISVEELGVELERMKWVNSGEVSYIQNVFELVAGDYVDQAEFCVIAALAERVTFLDTRLRQSFGQTDFKKLEKNIKQYRHLFQLNANEESTLTYDDIKILLLSTGLPPQSVDSVASLLNLAPTKEAAAGTTKKTSVGFLDFLTYVPFFVMLHDRIVDDPFKEHLKGDQQDAGDVVRELLEEMRKGNGGSTGA